MDGKSGRVKAGKKERYMGGKRRGLRMGKWGKG